MLNNQDLNDFKDIFYISAKDLSIPAYPESESFIDVTNDTVLLRSDYPELSTYYPTSGSFSLFGSDGSGNFSVSNVNVAKTDGIYIRTYDSNEISFANNPNFSGEAYKNIGYFYNFSLFLENKLIRYKNIHNGTRNEWGITIYSYEKSDNMSNLVNSIVIEAENTTFFEEIPGVDAEKVYFVADQEGSGQNDNYIYFKSISIPFLVEPEPSANSQIVFCKVEDFIIDYTSQRFDFFNYYEFYPHVMSGNDGFVYMSRNGMLFLNKKSNDKIVLLDPKNKVKVDEFLLSDFEAPNNDGQYTVSQAMNGKDYLIINGLISSFIFEITETGFVFVEKFDGISIGYYTPGCYFFAEYTSRGYGYTFNKINTNGIIQDLTELGLTYNFIVSDYYYSNHSSFCSRRIVDRNEIQVRGTNKSYVYFLKFIEEINTFTIKGEDYGNGQHKTWILGV